MCQACKIPEAEAFLYERLGNVSSALQIYIDHALEAVQSLLRFVQRASISETRLQDIMNDRIPHSQLISRHSREAEDQSLAHYVISFSLDSCSQNLTNVFIISLFSAARCHMQILTFEGLICDAKLC